MTRSTLLSFFAFAPLFVACGSSDKETYATPTSTSTSSSGGGGEGGTGSGSGGGGGMTSAPSVTSNEPDDGAEGVATNSGVRVIFSQPMDCASLTGETFTLTADASATPVTGTVICLDTKAAFWPAAHLPSDSLFTATITTGAKNLAGVPIAADHVWSFSTGAVADAGLPVNLGTAAGFVILAKSGVSNVPTSAVTGNIGLSPAASSFITGFALSADPSNVFATSPQVTGQLFAADYAVPTPSNLTTAVLDMQLAFTEAAARPADVTELGAGDIGGMTLSAGVYAWGTGLLVPTDVTLAGAANEVWVFQVAGDLVLSSAVQVTLSGGAQAKNVFWQVAGLVDIGTTAHLEGVVLTQTAVTAHTGATVNGRLLAQTAVSLDGNTVTAP